MVSAWKRLSFVSQKYVKNLSCLITVMEGILFLCIYVFEELHQHRFFKNEFIEQKLCGKHYYLDIHQSSYTKGFWKSFPYQISKIHAIKHTQALKKDVKISEDIYLCFYKIHLQKC